jgi:glycosyltransferase involved in cell wall biosynthesis
LVDKAIAFRAQKTIQYIPNGIDLQRFNHMDAERNRVRLGLQGRVIGTLGNHENPLELHKVIEAAKALEHTKLNFIIAGRGAAVNVAKEHAKTAKLSNVRFFGYVDPSDMPNMLAAFDVGLCPYTKTKMDEARSPMRLFAYAAAGLPTVSTDLEEVRRLNFPNVVLVKDDAKALAQGILQALQMRRQQPNNIYQYDIHRLVSDYELVLQASK